MNKEKKNCTICGRSKPIKTCFRQSWFIRKDRKNQVEYRYCQSECILCKRERAKRYYEMKKEEKEIFLEEELEREKEEAVTISNQS